MKTKKVLLIDINSRASLPESLIYTAIQIERLMYNIIPVVLRLDAQDEKNTNIMQEITAEVISVLLWQQNWIIGEDGLRMISLARQIKRANKKVKVIAGGYLPVLAPNLYKNQEWFDTVLIGYPWNKDIISELFLDENKDILISKHEEKLPYNLTLREGERFINPSRFFKKINNNIASSYNFSYHCNKGCTFCSNYSFLKIGGGIIKDFNTITDEIDFLNSRYGVNIIDSKDANIFVNKDHGLKVLEYFAKSRRVKFGGTLDIMVNDMSEEVIDLLFEAGVTLIFFGLESFKENIRKKIKKPFSMKRLDALLSYGRKRDIFFMGNIMLGIGNNKTNPLTKMDVDNEKYSINSILKKHPNLSVQLRLFMPLLGTPLGDKIWNETEGSKSIDLESYLHLIDIFIKSKKFNPKYPLPSCFESIEVYNYAAYVSNILYSLNQSRMIRHSHRNKGFLLRSVSRLRQTILDYAFEHNLNRIVEYEKKLFDFIRMLYPYKKTN